MELIAGKTTERFFVTDHSYVGSTRRSIRELAERAGLNGEPLAKLDLLSTELSTNLAKHATAGGEIIFFDETRDDSPRVRLLCLDRGPGIKDMEQAATDGFSSAGSMGVGLGSLRRLSNNFEFRSAPGKGTIIICDVQQSEGNQQNRQILESASISVPHRAEKRCGDGVFIAHSDTMTSLLVVDGLGHGDGAADAADIAVRTFAANPLMPVMSSAERIHAALSGTRGAAMALAQIDHTTNRMSFVGVGNITARIYNRYSTKGCVSVQGIVGGRIGSLKEFTYDWEPEAGLLLHSDGIKSDASMSNSANKSALMEAAEIYRDFCRTTDDTTVVICKPNWRR